MILMRSMTESLKGGKADSRLAPPARDDPD